MKGMLLCILGLLAFETGCMHVRYTYFQPTGPGEQQSIPADGGPNNTLLVSIGGSTLHVQGEEVSSGPVIAMWFVVPKNERVLFSSKLVSISQGANHWTVSPEWHSSIVDDGKRTDEILPFDAVLSDATFSGSFPAKGRVHSAYRAEIQEPQGLCRTEPFTMVLPGSNEISATTIVFTPQVADYWHAGQLQ